MDQESLKENLFRQLEECRSSRHLHHADEIIASLLANYPDDAGVWAEIAYFHSFSKRLDTAVEAISKAIAYAPEEPAYYFNRSKSYLGVGNFSAALQDAERAIELGNRHGNTYYTTAAEFLCAEALCKLKRYHEAAAIANHLAEDAGWWLAYGYRCRADILRDCTSRHHPV